MSFFSAIFAIKILFMASVLMLCFDIWAFFVPAVIVVAVIILYIFWFFVFRVLHVVRFLI